MIDLLEMPEIEACAEWDADELAALRPREPLTCSQWAERHRVLREDNAIWGPWRNANAPYLRGIMDLGFKRGVREIAGPKAAQVGWSEAGRNILLYIAHYHPAPTGILLPDREKGEQIIKDKVLPAFRETPPTRALMTSRVYDLTKSQITLANPFTLYLMWSGSPSSLASNPMRFAFADEVDKYPKFSGDEGDPLSLLRDRLTTFNEQSRLWKPSTPTTRLGAIWREHEAATIKLYYLVACPNCGVRQRLLWDSIKWEIPKEIIDPPRRAAWLLDRKNVWCECRACGHRIEEREKLHLVGGGVWGTCDERGLADGQIDDAERLDRFPDGTKLSMHISALYPRWINWSTLAAQFIEATAAPTIGPLFDFVTGRLGEPFEQRVSRIESNQFSTLSKRAALPEGVVPAWAACLIASIDTQKDHFYVVIRAWGPGFRSQRIWHGIATSFDELDRICATPFTVKAGYTHPPMSVVETGVAVIDTGGNAFNEGSLSRTQEVYWWAMSRTGWVLPLKGANKPVQADQGYKMGRGYFDPGDGRDKIDIPLWLVDVQRYQDELTSLVHRSLEQESDEEAIWRLNGRDDPVYNSHLSSMHKIAIRERGEYVDRWVPVRAGARVDYRHLEVYQIFAAFKLRINHLLMSREEYIEQKRIELIQLSKVATPENGRRFTTPWGQPFVATEREH